MEERGLQGQVGGLRCARPRQTEGRVVVVENGLGNTPEDEADAHPRLEEHGEPSEVAELGFVVRGAELDLAVAGKGQVDDEDEEEGGYEHVHPTETLGDPA